MNETPSETILENGIAFILDQLGELSILQNNAALPKPEKDLQMDLANNLFANLNYFLNSHTSKWQITGSTNLENLPLLEQRKKILYLFHKFVRRIEESSTSFFINTTPQDKINAFPAILEFIHGNAYQHFIDNRRPNQFICNAFNFHLQNSVARRKYFFYRNNVGIVCIGKGKYSSDFEPDTSQDPINLYGKRAIFFLQDLIVNGQIFHSGCFYTCSDHTLDIWEICISASQISPEKLSNLSLYLVPGNDPTGEYMRQILATLPKL